MVPPTFLRFDRRELEGNRLVIRAVPEGLRRSRRFGLASPLGYLYEQVSDLEPASDESFDAGHYDPANLVWSFSGEVTGITGLTEPMPANGSERPPDEHDESEVN
ncbi:MAG: hypothetical protein ACRD2C_03980 [Acidimicrobiales bacterium]